MPFSIQPNQIITIHELEDYLKAHGVLAPGRTIRKLLDSGMTIRAGKLILGHDLLIALDRTEQKKSAPTQQSAASQRGEGAR